MRLPISLRAPQYRRYVAANFFALQGVWAQRAVIAWLAWEMTEQASWVGFVAFLSFAPVLISGPVFGVWADRANLKRATILVLIAQAAIGAALTMLILSGALTIQLLSAVGLAQGVANSAHHPVRMALTTRLAPREALANAIAVSSLNFNVARLTGPAAGGFAIAAIGPGLTTAATVALYLPVLAIMRGLAPRPAEGGPPERETILAALTEGARFDLAHDAIRAAMGVKNTSTAEKAPKSQGPSDIWRA